MKCYFEVYLLTWCDDYKKKVTFRFQHHLPDNLLQALGTCEKDSFPNINCLLVIACTLPISSAEAERSFYLLRRIKTYLRSTMSKERLSDLSVIAMHYGEQVSADEVCQASHPRRLLLFIVSIRISIHNCVLSWVWLVTLHVYVSIKHRTTTPPIKYFWICPVYVYQPHVCIAV